jgi:RND superfamily putative drug exporter
MTFSSGRIARGCARRPWTTLVAWAVALVLAIGASATLLGSALTSEGAVTSNPESEQGYALIGRHFPPDPREEYVNEFVLVRSARLTADDPAFRRKVEDVLGAVRASGAVHNARAYFEGDDGTLVAPGRHATVIPIGVRGDCEASAERLIRIVEAADGGDFDVRITGECTVDRDINVVLDHDLKTGEL